MKKSTYIIDRATWRNGDCGNTAIGQGDTALLNEEGFMCCLGQVMCQQGFDREHIMDQGEPYNVLDLDLIPEDSKLVCDVKENVHELVTAVEPDEGNKYWEFNNTKLAMDAININDRIDTPLRKRETELRELFKKHNIILKFKGKSQKFKRS